MSDTDTAADASRLALFRRGLTRRDWRSLGGMVGFILLLHVIGFGVLFGLVVPKHFHFGGVHPVFTVGVGVLAYTFGLRLGPLDLILVESGGDNLTATFSKGLIDPQIFVVDVAGGNKVPRKGGPGVTTTADLLVINKTDLAPLEGADLAVMDSDARARRGDLPTIFQSLAQDTGAIAVADWIRTHLAGRPAHLSPTMPDEIASLIALCREAEAACERHRSERLRRAGYPDLHRLLLPVLHQLAEQDATIGTLAAALGVSLHEARHRVSALEACGYLRRHGRPGDVRDRPVQITTAGRAAADLDRRLETDLEQHAVAGLSGPDLTTARQVVARLIRAAAADRPPQLTDRASSGGS